MKKTLLAAAVASATSFAMADISITGDAKFEYDHNDTGTSSSNTSNTEMHINFAGKTGDTSVVAKFELDTAGDNGAGIDLEDNYITTKIGDISVKAGNYASGTSGLLGEIEEGGRATNKVTLGYKVGGVDFYIGNSDAASSEAANSGTVNVTGTGTNATTTTAASTGVNSTTGTVTAVTGATFTSTADAADGDTTLDNNMFAGAKFSVAGQNIEVKKNSDTKDSWGIKGSVSGINYRYEASDDDTDGDTSYVEISTKVAGVTLQYAALEADATEGLEETDSTTFAQEAANSRSANSSSPKKQSQIAASTAIDGTTLTVKSGTIEDGIDAGVDQDYLMLSASRPLASGATLVVTYNDNDTGATTSTENLEVELNVKF
jgi:hypothetical protein